MERKRKPIYEIVKTEEYLELLNDIYKRFPRITDLNKSVEWQLQRAPHLFEKINNNFYHWVTGELINPNIPRVKILYRIIEEPAKVIMLSIEEI